MFGSQLRAREAREAALKAFTLLVLAFWVGGGLLIGTVGPLYVGTLEEARRSEAAGFLQGLRFWLSTTELVCGAALFAVLFFLDRARKKTLVGLGSLVVLVVVNEYIVGNWMLRYQPGDSTYEGFHSAYQAIFVVVLVGAAVLFVSSAVEPWVCPTPRPAPAPPPA
jgi:hypothetical protein